MYLIYLIWRHVGFIQFGHLRHGLNGPAHVQKNFCSNLRSPIRTIVFGQFFCDYGSALDTGLPPGCFVGFDGMSDREAATLLNGFLHATGML